MDETKVIKLRDGDPILSLLQDELYTVINSERYASLSMGSIVGIIEFLKWNIINGSY